MYDHNAEFAWLLVSAGDVLGKGHCHYAARVKRLIDHAVRYGVEPKHGGVYCSGPHESEATNRFWENMEVLPGFPDAYEVLGDPAYLRSFHAC